MTKEELLDAIWPETHVSDGVLKVCIRELRQALGDTAQEASYIETLHRRGYRFVASVETDAEEPEAERPTTTPLVGRTTERHELGERLARAMEGTRQIVFVTGTPGIGKTTLVDRFVEEVAASEDPPWIARGQCVDHYGASEAYLPFLEALTRLGRGPAGPHVLGLLREHAPSWLLQLPGLLSTSERDTLRREHAGSGPERMLRELTVGLDAISAVRPLVLVLEDLHWSDHSTVELLSALARGRGRTRCLVVATLRPADAMAAEHPLPAVVRELRTRGLATELPLGPLDEDAVEAFLGERFASPIARELSPRLFERTEGHPLFLVHMVDHLVDSGALREESDGWQLEANLAQIEEGTPDSLRDALDAQLHRLDDAARRILATAALAGLEFSTPLVAAGLDEPVQEVERACATLARRGEFLKRLRERTWPDGTTAVRYAFGHALYRETLAQELEPSERTDLHRRIGTRLESAFSSDPGEVAAQLALHFEEGGDRDRAIRYLHLAGDRATSLHAYTAAVDLLNRALRLVEDGEEPGRSETELVLRASLGAPLLNLRGFGSTDVEKTYARALDLCQSLGETPQLFPVLMGLEAYYSSSGQLPRAFELAEQVMHLAERVDDRVMRLEGHHALGCDLLRLARVTDAEEHLEAAIALTRPEEANEAYRLTGHDPKTCCQTQLAVAKYYLGRPDEAVRLVDEALAWSQEIRLPFSLAQAYVAKAWVHLLRFEPNEGQPALENALRVSEDYDLLYWRAMATLLDAWAIGQQGRFEDARARAREGRALADGMGPRACESEYLVIDVGLAVAADPTETTLQSIDDAIQITTALSENLHRAELERQRGELLLRLPTESGLPDYAKAREWIARSLETAREQGALPLQMKAAGLLVLFRGQWPDAGDTRDEVDILASILDQYGDTQSVDVQLARSVLDGAQTT